MNTPALDLATRPASSQQRRAALASVAAMGVVALVSVPTARVILGTFPGFITLYGGAVLTGLAITAMILFGQFALSRRPSLLALACGTTFSGIVFVPYILSVSSIGSPALIDLGPHVAAYLWLMWQTALPASFATYALLAPHDGARRVGSKSAVAALVLTSVAAYVAIHAVVANARSLPPLSPSETYSTAVYVSLGIVVLFSGSALLLLQWRANRSVVDAWLTVPTAALFLEAILNALGGSRYSVGWYVSRVDVLVATTFLVVALLDEMNRLSNVLVTNERRLRGIVNGVADALVTVDARGAIASLNPAAAALFGFVAEDLIGAPISRVLPDYAAVAETVEAAPLETTARDARGNVFPVEFACGRDASGTLGEAIIILRDITQRKAAQEATRAAHDRAVEAAEVKSQFVATMSHEIRTPINAVVGMSELMLQMPLPDEAREYATTVRDSAESLLAIVNDILDFSKIDAGRMQLEQVPFSPVVAVENASDILAAAARKKGLALSTYVANDVPRRVVGDVDRLRQVLLNLVGNAVKFTAQGNVMVRAVVETSAEHAVMLRFSVTDTGPGIAPEAAHQLFEPFRQGDQSTRRRFGGTGLGLSISRRIVEAMGGKIGFDSRLGGGSTFWFAVPFSLVNEETGTEPPEGLRGARILVVDQDATARQIVDQYLVAWGAVASSTGNPAHALELARASIERRTPFDAIIADRRAGGDAFGLAARVRNVAGCDAIPLAVVTNADEPVEITEAQAAGFAAVIRKPIRQAALYEALLAMLAGRAQPAIVATTDVEDPVVPDVAGANSGILVLVAEDNPVNRKLALQQLKKLGYRAHAVTDGREAVEAVAHGRYDVVLMDCQMPEMDGFEATQEIRRAEVVGGGHVPIVAMTANALDGDREACLAAGMDAYLAKPVQLAALRAVVERFANGIGIAG